MPKSHILFVDDEERIIRSVSTLFRPDDDLVIHTAVSADEAIYLTKKFPIQVIVSDQRMPGMTGVELLKEVRRLSPNTMGILLTGYAELGDIVGSINESEIFRYLTKPWKNDDLKETVYKALGIAGKLFGIGATQTSVATTVASAKNDSIMVLKSTDDTNIGGMVQKLFPEHAVNIVDNIDGAMQFFVTSDIAVVVVDIGANNKDSIGLVKTIKQYYPLTLSIVVADGADAKTAIALINQGQVYRYLPKPLKPGRLKLSVSSALNYYRKVQNSPVQLLRHQVDIAPEKETASIAARYSKMLSMLQSRMRHWGN